MLNLKEKKVFAVFAMASPWRRAQFPALSGNNWLLTREFAFIDLFFFSLLA